MNPSATATWQAGQEAFERFLLNGRTMQEYLLLNVVVAIGALALVIIFWTLVYLNRDALRKRFRDWLNK